MITEEFMGSHFTLTNAEATTRSQGHEVFVATYRRGHRKARGADHVSSASETTTFPHKR